VTPKADAPSQSGASTVETARGAGRTEVPDTGQLAGLTSLDDVLLLLDQWIADESGYEEATWDELKAALDEDRLSDRQFFRE
jgi:hypothetical protein